MDRESHPPRLRDQPLEAQVTDEQMSSHETKAAARKAVKAIFDEKFTNIPTEKSSSKLSKDILSAELVFAVSKCRCCSGIRTSTLLQHLQSRLWKVALSA